MKITQYMREVRAEMAKVQWPNMQEFIGAMIITLIVVLFFMIFIGVVDRGLSLLMNTIFSYF